MGNLSFVIEYLKYLKERDKIIKAILLLSICSVTFPAILYRIKFSRKKKAPDSEMEDNPSNSKKLVVQNKLKTKVYENDSQIKDILNQDEILNDLSNRHWLLHGLNPVNIINATMRIENGSDGSSEESEAEIVEICEDDNETAVCDESNTPGNTKKQLDKSEGTHCSDAFFNQASTSVSRPGTVIDKSKRLQKLVLTEFPVRGIDSSISPISPIRDVEIPVSDLMNLVYPPQGTQSGQSAEDALLRTVKSESETNPTRDIEVPVSDLMNLVYPPQGTRSGQSAEDALLRTVKSESETNPTRDIEVPVSDLMNLVYPPQGTQSGQSAEDAFLRTVKSESETNTSGGTMPLTNTSESVVSENYTELSHPSQSVSHPIEQNVEPNSETIPLKASEQDLKSQPSNSPVMDPNYRSPTDENKYFTDPTGEDPKSYGKKGKMPASSRYFYRKRSSKSTQPETIAAKKDIDTQITVETSTGDADQKENVTKLTKPFPEEEKQSQILSGQPVSIPSTSQLSSLCTNIESSVLDENAESSSVFGSISPLSSGTLSSSSTLTSSSPEASLGDLVNRKNGRIYFEITPEGHVIQHKIFDNSENDLSDDCALQMGILSDIKSTFAKKVEPTTVSDLIPQIEINKTVVSAKLEESKKRLHSQIDTGHKKQKTISENEQKPKAFINPRENFDLVESDPITRRDPKPEETRALSEEPTDFSIISSDSNTDAAMPKFPLPSFSLFKNPPFENTPGDLVSTGAEEGLPCGSQSCFNEAKDISDTESTNDTNSDSTVIYLENVSSISAGEMEKEYISTKQKSNETCAREIDVETGEESVDTSFHQSNRENESTGQTGRDLIKIQSENDSAKQSIEDESEESLSEIGEIPQEYVHPAVTPPQIGIEQSPENSESNTEAVIEYLTKEFEKRDEV